MANTELTHKQRKAALLLLIDRPACVPGTCAIIDSSQAGAWHRKVAGRALKFNIKPEQLKSFCDTAGVAD